jgi:hypothetical protein
MLMPSREPWEDLLPMEMATVSPPSPIELMTPTTPLRRYRIHWPLAIVAIGLAAATIGTNARNAWSPSASIVDNGLAIAPGILVGIAVLWLASWARECRGLSRVIAVSLWLVFVGFDLINSWHFAEHAQTEAMLVEAKAVVGMAATKCPKNDKACVVAKSRTLATLPTPQPDVLLLVIRTALPSLGGLLLMVARAG